jgi:thioesterase domain-containing protein/acyl carrier protein
VSESAPSSSDSSSSAKKGEQDFWAALRAAVTTQQQAPPLLPVSRETPLPLSYAQERLWLLDQLQPDNNIFHLPYAFRLSGRLDRQILHESLQEMIKRHEILRTRFTEVEGQPVTVIDPNCSLLWEELDLRSIPPTQQMVEGIQHIQKIFAQPFSLAVAPLFRAVLIQNSEEEHLLGLCFHHIIFDGWSEGLFFKELAMFYDTLSQHQPPTLVQLPIQYGDYALWQRNWLRGEGVAPQRQYWTQHLAQGVDLKLPYDGLPAARSDHGGSRQTLTLDASLTRSLRELSQGLGVTLFTLLLTAFQALLHRYSGQEDLLLCSPVAGRSRPEVQSLIGYFNNILPLRCQVSGEMSLTELIQQVRTVTLDALQHQDIPLQQVGSFANVIPSALSRVLFALLNVPQHPLQLAGMAVESLDIPNLSADFEIFCCWQEQQAALTARLDYKTALFQSQSIADLLCNYRSILESIVADPEQRIAEIPLSVTIPNKQILNPSSPAKENLTKPLPIGSLTETEQTLVQVFSQVSGLASLDSRENLLNLGISSLEALTAFDEIEQTFGRKLPLSTLIQSPTVAAIAQLLDHAEPTGPWTPLVILQSEGTRSPFFCVPGLAGNVLYLRKLAEYLGTERPFYGLQARGTDGREASFNTVEDMAAYYIQAIQTVQPQGPYYLGGHSFGALVAWEMAQQLTAQGQRVALLALIDRRGPNLRQKLDISSWERISLKLANWKALVQEDQWNYLKKELLDRVDYWGEKLLTKNRYRRWFRKSPNDRVSTTHWQAMEQYSPTFYPGRLSLFTAKIKRTYEAFDPLLGWNELAADVEVFQVPGSHVGMLKDPYVKELAAKLKLAIQRD